MSKLRILYLEPYNSGSHEGFTNTLREHIDAQWTCLTLPGRHWKWRARGSGVWFARAHAQELAASYDLLLASAYVPLADLMALTPSLHGMPRLLYFHENQLAYPMQPEFSGERDLHFGFSQMVSGLAATHCLFNSQWNMDSFLEAGQTLLGRMPDAVPPGWIEALRARSQVLPVPLSLPSLTAAQLQEPVQDRSLGPVILWNHRWEYDKNPQAFFEALFALSEEGCAFRLIVCGERFRRAPPIFAQAEERLAAHLLHWGYAPSREAYEALLLRAHIAVSTTDHEFFGVSMVEATHFGARPLVPNRLAYPEIFPEVYRYEDDQGLLRQLRDLCAAWTAGAATLREDRRHLTQLWGKPLLDRYRALFASLVPHDGDS